MEEKGMKNRTHGLNEREMELGVRQLGTAGNEELIVERIFFVSYLSNIDIYTV